MRKIVRYETPEIEITRFEIKRALMDSEGPIGDDKVEFDNNSSETETPGDFSDWDL